MAEENPLIARLDRALVEAMKARNAARTSALRMVRAALKNRQIDKRAPLDDADALQILATLAKQRRESIEQFQAGGRSDLVEKETAELRILQEFLPEEMGERELRSAVLAAVQEAGASGLRDLGKVMALLMPRVKGRADGKLVNAIVREVLWVEETLNGFDWVILGGVGLFAVKGALRGFFRGAFGLLALWAGVAVPLRFGPQGRAEAGSWGLGSHLAYLVAYALLFLIPYVGLHLVGSVLHRLVRAVFLGGFDRLGGGVLGALTGALLMGAIVHVLGVAGWGQGFLAHSRLAGPVGDGFHLALRWATAR